MNILRFDNSFFASKTDTTTREGFNFLALISKGKSWLKTHIQEGRLVITLKGRIKERQINIYMDIYIYESA